MNSKCKNPRTRALAIRAKTAYKAWQANITDQKLWQASMDSACAWLACYGLHSGGTLMGAGDHARRIIADLKNNRLI